MQLECRKKSNEINLTKSGRLSEEVRGGVGLEFVSGRKEGSDLS